MRRTGGQAVNAWHGLAIGLGLLSASPPARLPAQSFEQRLLAIPDTASVRQMSKDLSAVPHMAGTPAQATTRDYVVERLKSWGVDAWSKEYTVYIPQPDTVAAWIIPGPRAKAERLSLAEPGNGPQIPPFDGYFRGDVYPKGPMRPVAGIQRGSMMNGNGDPTTPTWASVEGARRLPEDSLDIPRIPIIPMSYGNARRFLEPMTGASVPQSWQGALPFRYHVGPGPARARLHVKTERGQRAFHKIWNTIGMIRGARWPDEWVVVGGHRDAWGPGARDNVSGTVCVLETARAFAELARDGQRPARSVVFATWDAEEWGLIGSTEWVEELEDTLRARVVTYINEDGTFSGPNFGGSGSPSLKPLLRSTAHIVQIGR